MQRDSVNCQSYIAGTQRGWAFISVFLLPKGQGSFPENCCLFHNSVLGGPKLLGQMVNKPLGSTQVCLDTDQASANIFRKDGTVTILGFAGHMVSVVMSLLLELENRLR